MKNVLHLFLLVGLAVCLGGCVTPPEMATDDGAKARATSIILRPGDVLKISFPGSPNLDTVQQIRRDGKISLSLVGEVVAAELTPDDLQKKLIELYMPQISSHEIYVAIQSSTFPVFVSGAVIHPGKVMADHPLTALEAVMEAGGYDNERANMKAVKITRNEQGVMKTYVVDLKAVLDGRSSKPYYLKPDDIVFVPDKLQLF